MKKEILLEGLNCPNCAARIEADVAKLPEVVSASMNLMKQTLALEITGDEDILGQVEKIVHRYEPDVKVREKAQATQSHDHSREMDTKKLFLR